MKKSALLLVFTLGLAQVASAQLVIDDFNAPVVQGQGSELLGTTWVGQVTQNATSITIGGNAKDDNGWGSTDEISLNVSAYDQITIIGQRDINNLATTFAIGFDDGEFNTQSILIPMSSFSVGVMTTVVVPIAWTNVNPMNIVYFSLGGGNSGASTFRMTLDDISLTSSSAIPEPSTYAAIFGALALGFVAYRRRMVRVA